MKGFDLGLKSPTHFRRFVGLVGCGKSKLPVPAPARKLYTGPLTKMCIQWIDRNCSTWYILSAKYGVVKPETKLKPYNTKMSDLTLEQQEGWGRQARVSLSFGRAGPYLVLAGVDYVRALGISDDLIVDPCKGLRMGERMAWLKAHPVLTDALVKELTGG